MSDSQVKNREQIEFEELNRWQRHTDNISWTVTSVFLTINIIAISTIIANWNTIQCTVLLGFITSLVFIVLWIFLLRFVERVIRIAIQLRNRIVELGRNWDGFVGSFNHSANVDQKVRICAMQTLLRTNWGVLTLSFAIMFIIFWGALFIYFGFTWLLK